MTTSVHHRLRTQGFTLVELLTVLLIIGILMALILGTARFAHYKNLETRAKANLETLATALTDYKMDYGSFPDESNWTNALVARGFAPEDSEFIDPWGNAYIYLHEDEETDPSSRHTYRLLSLGRDGMGDPDATGAGDPEETFADNLEVGRY